MHAITLKYIETVIIHMKTQTNITKKVREGSLLCFPKKQNCMYLQL